MFSRIVIALALFIPLTVLAQQSQQAMTEQQLKALLGVKIRTVETLAFSPSLIQAVEQQNAQSLSLEVIQKRDADWSASDKLTPLKVALQRNKAGKYLKHFVDINPAINEAFLTDNQGANVAAYPATSDYWQGDEEKWTAVFNNASGKTYVGPLERDESTQTVQVQISTVVRNANKATIGVLIMGVSLSYMEDRQSPQSQ